MPSVVSKLLSTGQLVQSALVTTHVTSPEHARRTTDHD